MCLLRNSFPEIDMLLNRGVRPLHNLDHRSSTALYLQAAHSEPLRPRQVCELPRWRLDAPWDSEISHRCCFIASHLHIAEWLRDVGYCEGWSNNASSPPRA